MTDKEISFDSDPMRVFVLAPAGRDATVTAGVLSEGGFSVRICTSIGALCVSINEAAGAAVIAQEALAPAALDQLVAYLSKQPPWSDFPLILLIGGRDVATAISRILEAVGTAGSITLLERPMLREALLSAVRVALRSRRRQYEIRDHLERQNLLVAELSHRVKNTLATVLSVARLTLSRAESLDEFDRSFRGRIQALAAAHDLLTAVNWDVAGLRVLVERALQPYASGDGSNVQISGDEVFLRPSAALTFSLVLHELTANAAKHGALQRPEGVVAVDYGVRSKRGRELHLHWAETGGGAGATAGSPRFWLRTDRAERGLRTRRAGGSGLPGRRPVLRDHRALDRQRRHLREWRSALGVKPAWIRAGSSKGAPIPPLNQKGVADDWLEHAPSLNNGSPLWVLAV